MRFVDLFLISFLPLALSQATLSARGGTCEEWDLTREHPSCQCLPGFENPGKAHKECTCADEKNTQVIVTEVNKNDHALLVAKCECFGGSQTFDIDAKECKCDSGYDGAYSDGELICKKSKPRTKAEHHHSTSSSSSSSTSSTATPTPTGYWGKRSKRTLHEAIRMKKKNDVMHARLVEDVLGCENGQKACETEGSWACTDIMSSLTTCGGCAGEALDCASLPDVNEVRCNAGRCVIESCGRGFELKSTGNAANSIAPSSVCAKISKSSWFQLQDTTDL